MSDPKADGRMGTLSYEGYRFLAHTAQMWRVSQDDKTRQGWGFRIRTESPTLEAEDEPIPLPDRDDLTGVDFRLDPSYDLDTGGVYFSFTATAWHEVSQLRIRFVEKNEGRYRVELSATVHHVSEASSEVRYEGWIDVVEK